jgi:hypothetical protein
MNGEYPRPEPYDPDERRQEVKMDGSGMSSYVARGTPEPVGAPLSDASNSRGYQSVRRPRTRDFESDRDHADEMAALPPNFVEEPDKGEPIENPKFVARLGARRALTASMAEKLGKDSPQYRIWLARYNEEHPLDIEQQRGA